MFITLNPTGNRLAVLAALALALSLLAGCNDEPAAGIGAENSAHASSPEAVATERRKVTLSVPGMDCPMCPITVRRALKKVDGVFEAEADLERKEARAVFDPARTDAGNLITAVENSGFSATLKDGDNE